jgi:hypothetical protein
MILANHGIISSSGGSIPLLLDTYSGASAAYSLRKLNTSYTGYAIRVRRSSDNTSQDIGFVNGNLDTTSISSFVGANDGFVSIWYDQSGNSNNQSSATLIKQPQIVNSGSLITQNSKPALYFSSSTMQSNRIFSSSDFSIFSNISGGSGQSNAVFLAQHAGTADIGRTVFLSPSDATAPYDKLKMFFNNGNTYNIVTNNVVLDNTLKLVHSTSNGAGLITTIYINGNQEAQLTGQSWTPYNTNFTIGDLGSSTSPFTGYSNEIICYTTNQLTNRTGIESNINSYYSIY